MGRAKGICCAGSVDSKQRPRPGRRSGRSPPRACSCGKALATRSPKPPPPPPGGVAQSWLLLGTRSRRTSCAHGLREAGLAGLGELHVQLPSAQAGAV